MAKTNNHIGTTVAKVRIYETTSPLLEAMQAELRELSKKKPEATLNKKKVALINRLLCDIRELLKDEDNSKYLDILDDESLPQYSDVVLIVSQYVAAMHAFESRYKPQDPITYSREWALR